MHQRYFTCGERTKTGVFVVTGICTLPIGFTDLLPASRPEAALS